MLICFFSATFTVLSTKLCKINLISTLSLGWMWACDSILLRDIKSSIKSSILFDSSCIILINFCCAFASSFAGPAMDSKNPLMETSGVFN